MTFSLALATKNAFSMCAASAAASLACKTALIFTSNTLLGEALADYIQLTLPARCILLSTGEMQPPLTPDGLAGPDLCLILLQPVKDQPFFESNLLHQPNLRQILVLQATSLGQRILPEWQLHPGQRLVSIARLRKALTWESGWSCRETAIGSLAGLAWGFLSGRLLALNRPDLADRCNARMRQELLPTGSRKSFMYLSLAEISRENPVLIS